MTEKGNRASRRWRRLGRLGAGGFVVAAIGIVVVLAVYGASSGGDDEFAPAVVEEPSDGNGAESFQGGPRAHFPVDSVDLGQVPLNTEVSYAFDLMNVGDATLRIEDVQVKVLEGC